MSGDVDGLPRGWQTTTLREIAEIVGGVTKDTKKSQGQGLREVPYLRVANVQRGHLDLNDVKLIAASEADIQKLTLQPGDLLLNEGGDRDKLGRGWIWQGQLPVCIHQNHVFRARLQSREIDPVYIAHFANSMAQSYFTEHGSQTTNLASISLTKLGSLPIQLPPPREQTRIVEKLEELLSDLDAGVAELKAAQKKLAQYRQSLLKAAVEGALTAEWRQQNPPTETGAQLLQRILTERRARWEARQLAKFKEQGKAPPKDWQKKYPEPVQPDTNDLPELPQGWVWASVDQLAAIGTGVTPLRSKAAYFDAGSVPWVNSGALNSESVTEASDFVTPLALRECRLALYPVGTLLVAMYGEGKTRGKCSELAMPATINQAIAALVLEGISCDCKSHLKSYLLKSYDDMRNQASGGVQPNLNLQIIRSISVPLPPLQEQREIQSVLEVQLGVTREQAAVIDLALKQSTAQRQNILRAAFAGQLVPQDPADEPASVLLERIRAERATQEPTKNPGGRKKKEIA